MDLPTQNSFFRIVDAAANRASEGLRVAEDVARMHLSDRFLSSELKQLRHDLTEQTRPLVKLAVVSRDSVGDVGRTIQVGAEYERNDAFPEGATEGFESLLIANFKRAQQAIRTLEEFAKNLPDTAANVSSQAIEQIRYRSYTIEKACRIAMRSSTEFESPSIYVLIDGVDWGQFCSVDASLEPKNSRESELAAKVRALVRAKVDFIQLRDKALSDRQLVAAGKLIVELACESQTRFIMNDRPDLAVACGAGGVHVGQEELAVADVRKIVGPAMLIGVSTHSLDQAKAAMTDGANYIGVGPVFPSQTKSFSEHVGVDLVRDVCDAVSLPAFAIGGIGVENARQVAEAGCHRVAVTAAFSQVPFEQYTEVAVELRKSLAVKT